MNATERQFLSQILAAGEAKSSEQSEVNLAATAGRLRELFDALRMEHEFYPGQLVEWKPGMKNKDASGPFIVSEVLPEPVFDTTGSSGNPYFREPLDLIVALIDDDDDFLEIHVDSRRFQPYSGPTPETI